MRIINLVDRADRRREMLAQLERIGAADDPRIGFFAATRPADTGGFPSIGARGCFESHLAVVRAALADGVDSVLVLEDDFDFAADIAKRGPIVMTALAAAPWDIFYGASVLDGEPPRADALIALAPDEAVLTASFVAFRRSALELLEPFLTAILSRPPGSPEFGPMHVDGAYSVFRRQFPHLRTMACKPDLGDQRASRSDITPRGFILDRMALTRPIANRLRRLRSRFKR